jgi:hypothetical protein
MPARMQKLNIGMYSIDNFRDGVSMMINGGQLFGWDVLPAIHDPVINAALTDNACSILLDDAAVTTDHIGEYNNCTAAFAGAFKRSYYSVAVNYGDVAQKCMNNIPPDNTSSAVIWGTTSYLSDLAYMTKFENPHFRNISMALSERILTNMQHNLNSSLSTLTLVSILFVILFCLFVFVGYVPMIRATGRHVAATQAILLMFTDKQLSEIPSLRYEVKATLAASSECSKRQTIAVLEIMVLLIRCLRVNRLWKSCSRSGTPSAYSSEHDVHATDSQGHKSVYGGNAVSWELNSQVLADRSSAVVPFEAPSRRSTRRSSKISPHERDTVADDDAIDDVPPTFTTISQSGQVVQGEHTSPPPPQQHRSRGKQPSVSVKATRDIEHDSELKAM